MRNFFRSLNPLGWAFLVYTVAFPSVFGHTGSWLLVLLVFLVCAVYLAVSS